MMQPVHVGPLSARSARTGYMTEPVRMTCTTHVSLTGEPNERHFFRHARVPPCFRSSPKAKVYAHVDLLNLRPCLLETGAPIFPSSAPRATTLKSIDEGCWVSGLPKSYKSIPARPQPPQHVQLSVSTHARCVRTARYD